MDFQYQTCSCVYCVLLKRAVSFILNVKSEKDSESHKCKRLPLQPFNSRDLISNSPYCLPYNSCDVSFENLVLDQLLIF